MKKNGILLLVVVMVLSLFLAACGSSEPAAETSEPAAETSEPAAAGEETITLKFLHRWPDELYDGFFNDMAREYEASHPGVKIDVQAIANDPFKEKIKVVLGTDEAPDVFFTWPGEFTNRFIRAGKVMDLTDVMMEDNYIDNYVASQMEPFTVDGKIYGAPVRVDGKIFVYNKELFAQAGVEVPETWEEFVTVCEQLDAAGIVPIAFGNQAPWAVSHYVGTLNQKIVGEPIHDAYDPATGDFSDPGFVTALEEFERIVPYFNKNTNGIRHSEARENWIAGKAAMMYIEIVEIPEIERSGNQDIIENYGVFQFPIVEGGKGDQTLLTGYPEGFVVSNTTKHPEEAIDFFKYITGKEVGLKEAQAVGWLNGAKGIAEKGQIPDSLYENTQIVYNAGGLVNWLDSGMHAKVTNEYLTDLQMLIDGLLTPQEVMDKVQEVATEVTKEF